MSKISDSIYNKKKRDIDRAEADRLEREAMEKRSSAKSDRLSAAGDLAGGLLSPSLIVTWFKGSAAGDKFRNASSKISDAEAYEQKAHELREKADNAPTFNFGRKKNEEK